MKPAYHETWLANLHVVKEAKRWKNHGFITSEQFGAISLAHPCNLFHPNFIIRVLLLIASLIALSGVTGMLGLIVEESNPGEDVIAVLCAIYGIVLLAFLDFVIIRNARQYKSGLNEALLYHSIGFIVGGVAGFFDFEMRVLLWTGLLILTFSSIRYVDLLSTIAALGTAAYILFFEFYEMGGVFQQIIPFLFIAVFTPAYFVFRKTKRQAALEPWETPLLIGEAFSLVMVYLAGNYLVVRELSINLMNLALAPGQDIPFAYLFYFLTVAIPVIYLYMGIRKRDVVMLRTSLVVLAFSVFTFKYYFSTGHHEITFTTSGAFLIVASIAILRYLKIPRNGFTRENLMSEKWASMNAEAWVISQTMGGNEVPAEQPAFRPGGGDFGGGGASGQF